MSAGATKRGWAETTSSALPGTEEDGEDRGAETMTIKPLGAGREVGRSCIVIKYLGKTIMLDCGIHPGYTGEAALPFFDAEDFEPSEVDLLIVSHFHLDHAAALPYFTEKTDFKGRIFMTHPTKAVMRMMLSDYIKIVNVSTENVLYDEKDLNACMDKLELIDFHQVMEHEGIRFWCYNAGHVLGAAMFMIEVAGARVLYTGDYSMEEDRHLMRAEVPSMSPDVLIVESTYGVQVHSPKEEREARFTSTVATIVRRGGRCLIPVFALGRAQELLLILDQYWQEHPEVQHIPVYYASHMASKALRVYQTYVNMMNEQIRRQMDVSNPFVFRHIRNLRSLDAFEDLGPSVVMAAPGMLQHGVSRELFDRWCSDERNGVVLAGYSVENTLAKKILASPDEVTGMDGRIRKLRCTVEYVSFSAHVDFVQNRQFIEAVAPADVVLVHGERAEMMRLEGELRRQFEAKPLDERPKLHTPSNTEEVAVTFPRDKVARAVGSVARRLDTASSVGALLVRKDFDTRLMAPGDVGTFSQLRVGGVRHRLGVPFYSSLGVLAAFIEEVYDDVELHLDENGGGSFGSAGSGTDRGSSGGGSGDENGDSGGAAGGGGWMVVHGVVKLTWAPAPAVGKAAVKGGGWSPGVAAVEVAAVRPKMELTAGAAAHSDGIDTVGGGGDSGDGGGEAADGESSRDGKLWLEWDASPANDMIADSIVTLAMQAQSSPGGIRFTSAARPCKHAHTHKVSPPAALAGGGAGGAGASATAAAAATAAASSAAKVEEEMDMQLLAAARHVAWRLLTDSYGAANVFAADGDGDNGGSGGPGESDGGGGSGGGGVSGGGGSTGRGTLRVTLDDAWAEVWVALAPETDLGWVVDVVDSGGGGDSGAALREQLSAMLGRLQEAMAGVPLA